RALDNVARGVFLTRARMINVARRVAVDQQGDVAPRDKTFRSALHCSLAQAATAVQRHYCGKRSVTVWFREKAAKSVARDVLWSLRTLASKTLLKATKGLRSALELYKRGGCRESVSAKNLHCAANYKDDHIGVCGRGKHRYVPSAGRGKATVPAYNC